MKKTLMLFAFTTLFAAQSFATYIVVLKDGTKYAAKAKWTVVNGKAIVQLENGQSLQLDPALIDPARSEQATKIGMASANVIDLDPGSSQATASKPQQQPLGSQIRLRRPPAAAEAVTPVIPAPAPAASGAMPADVLDKFGRAFENVGIYERKIVGTGANSLRAELTVDTEERVFNAISATSFLLLRNAGVDGVRIDVVELFMKTTAGGAAGRFQMTRADAEAIDQRKISQQEYFVRKVVY